MSLSCAKRGAPSADEVSSVGCTRRKSFRRLPLEYAASHPRRFPAGCDRLEYATQRNQALSIHGARTRRRCRIHGDRLGASILRLRANRRAEGAVMLPSSPIAQDTGRAGRGWRAVSSSQANRRRTFAPARKLINGPLTIRGGGSRGSVIEIDGLQSVPVCLPLIGLALRANCHDD